MMNKAFEKILERLEEPQFNIGCGACPIKEKCDEVQEAIDDEMTDLCAETMRVIAKEIVKTLRPYQKTPLKPLILLGFLVLKALKTLLRPLRLLQNCYKKRVHTSCTHP